MHDVKVRLEVRRRRLQGVLDRILVDCTAEERYAMTVKNVVDLYDLPFES